MSLLNVERDTETIIDYKLRNLAWQDHPHAPDRTVWKQSVKTEEQRRALGGLRPDYTLYPRDSDRPLAIIEAKKQGANIHAALSQGIEYATRLNAPLVFASDGVFTKTIHTKVGKPLILNHEEVDDLLREVQALRFLQTNEVNTLDKRVIQSRNDLITVFSKVNDLLREEGLQKGIERFSEFANILFLKVLSELEAIKEEHGEPSVIKRAYHWETFREMEGEPLLAYVGDTVLKGFSQDYDDPDIFQPLQIKHPDNLKAIIDCLDDLQLSDTHADIKGDAFEYFIRAYSASNPSDLGEIFTPRHIVKTMVKLLNPRIGEKVYDPFCGTGGMLIVAFKHIMDSMAQTPENIAMLRQQTLFGTELTRTASIAKMNMVIAGDGHSNIKRGDSFKTPVDDLYDVVITNFPFAQKTRYGSKYPIPSRNGDHISPQHCFRALRKGGRMAFIAPDGFLSNTNHHAYEDVRKYLLDHATLQSVVSLPRGSFEPYNRVKASILVFIDCHVSKSTNYYWNFDVHNDGYTLDKKREKVEGDNDLEIVLSERHLDQQSDDYLMSIGVSKINLEDVRANDHIIKASYYQASPITIGSAYDLIRLEDLLEKSGKDRIGHGGSAPIMSITMRDGLVDQKEKFKKRVASRDLSNYRKVYRNELVVGFPIDEGVLGFQMKYDYAAVSPAYKIWRLKPLFAEMGMNIEVLEMILRSHEMRTVYRSKMEGSVDRRRSIPDAIFLRIEIPIPSEELMIEIAEKHKAVTTAKQSVKERRLRLQSALSRLWGKEDAMKPTDELPFPGKDISPALQRTLKRKFESGEDESVGREAFFKLLGKAASEDDPSS